MFADDPWGYVKETLLRWASFSGFVTSLLMILTLEIVRSYLFMRKQLSRCWPRRTASGKPASHHQSESRPEGTAKPTETSKAEANSAGSAARLQTIDFEKGYRMAPVETLSQLLGTDVFEIVTNIVPNTPVHVCPHDQDKHDRCVYGLRLTVTESFSWQDCEYIGQRVREAENDAWEQHVTVHTFLLDEKRGRFRYFTPLALNPFNCRLILCAVAERDCARLFLAQIAAALRRGGWGCSSGSPNNRNGPPSS